MKKNRRYSYLNCTTKLHLLPSAECTSWKGCIYYLYVELILIYILYTVSRNVVRTLSRQTVSCSFEGISADRVGTSLKEWEGVKGTVECPGTHLCTSLLFTQLCLVSTQSAGGCDLSCHSRSMGPKVLSRTGWQEAISRKPVCMHQKGKSPWKVKCSCQCRYYHMTNHYNSLKHNRKQSTTKSF